MIAPPLTPILTQRQATNIDSLEPQYSCPAGSDLSDGIKSDSNPRWKEHLDSAAELFSVLDDISGVPSGDEGFHASFDRYFDNLSSRQCHAKPLPCKIGSNSTCVTEELADKVYRLGQWEYSHMYRDAEDSLAASAASYGVWVAELAANLRAATEGKNDVVYTHNVAHDGSVSRLLSILQVDEMVWPGMGAEVVFELYQKGNRSESASQSVSAGVSPEDGDSHGTEAGSEAYYVRVLFNGQVLKSSSPALGKLDMVPVETLLGYFDGLVGRNAGLVKGLCESSE